jgi:hypothetical protein
VRCPKCTGLLRYDPDYPALVCVLCGELLYVRREGNSLYPELPMTPLKHGDNQVEHRTRNSSREPRLREDGVDRTSG